MTPSCCSRSSSSLNLDLRAAGILREGVMTGRTSAATSRCTSPAKVPRGRSKTSGYCEIICSVVDKVLIFNGSAGVTFGGGGGTGMKWSWWMVTILMCWAACAPIIGIKFSLTTTNSMEYLLLFFGFFVITRVVPRGMTSELFHMQSRLLVGFRSDPVAYFSGKMFTVAPQSI